MKMFTDGATAVTMNIHFNGGVIGGIGGNAFNIMNVKNFSIKGVHMGSIAGASAIAVDFCKQFDIQGNVLESAEAGCNYMTVVGSVNCDNYTIIGNQGVKANQDLGSTHKVVANNLLYT